MNYDNYYKNGGMTKEESVSAIALRIGARKEAVAKFVEKNNIDTNKLNSDLKSGQVYFLDVITAIVGKPNNKYEKEIVKKYGSKMAMGGRTQGYDDREDERLGMKYGKMSGKDFDGSHDMREHSRRDDARFEERMEKGGKLYTTQMNVGRAKYVINYHDGSKTHKDGSPFYDIDIFSNRKDFDKAVKKLEFEGYKYRYADGGMMADGGKVRFYEGQSVIYPRINDSKMDNSVRNVHNKFANKELVIDKITIDKPYNTAKVFDRNSGEKAPFDLILNSKYVEQYADGGMMADGGEVYYVRDFYPNYDEDKIASILKSIGAKKVRKAKLYGYSNQPDVVVFEGDKNEAQEILEKEFPDNYISIYEKDWGRKMADGGMMADGGKIGSYRIIPYKIVSIKGSPDLAEAYYSLAFTVEGSLSEANEKAQKFVIQNENIFSATVTKIHPSGQALKNKKVSYVTKDEISKYEDGGMMADGGQIDEDTLWELSSLVMDSINPENKLSLDEFLYAHRNGEKPLMTDEQEKLVVFVLKMYDDVENITEKTLNELATLVMDSINSDVQLPLYKFMDEVPLTNEQEELCAFVLGMFDYVAQEYFLVKDSKTFEKGGAIENQYKNRSAQDIWESWNQHQKFHFLTDHKQHPYYNMGKEKFVVTNADKEKYMNMSYQELPKMIKLMISDHIEEGEYEKGGRVYKDWTGRNSKETWGKENLYPNYYNENSLNLVADVSDYYKELAKDVSEKFSQESKNNMIEVLKTGKITYNDGATLKFAKGGAIKGSNPSTGERFGVVIGSLEKEDGITFLTIRSMYSSRISSYELRFDEKGFLWNIADFGYTTDGTFPDMKKGNRSVRMVNADNKKESIDAIAKITSPSFAKKVYDYVHEEKMAKGGMLKEDDYVWNEAGKKLVVNKVSDDEYFLSAFGQVGDSPFSKEKVEMYLKNGQWSRKPKMAEGGETKNKWEYTDTDEIEYVVVKDKSGKELKFDGKDVISGVHDLLEKGGKLTEIGKYYSKNDVVSVVVNGKNILDKNTVSGVWIKKDAKPMAQDVAGMKIGKTTIRKGVNGWVAKTMVDNFKGFDWEITTIKNFKGDLVTIAQAGKSEDKGGYQSFTFMVFQDPSIRLKSSRPPRVTDKVVTAQHEEAMKDWKERQDEISEMVDQIQAKKKSNDGAKITSNKLADGGAIGFDALAKKVAKNYEGDKVKKEFQDEYGKTYDKKEAEEVGKKVAGKVYRQQQAKGKMAKGGKVAKKTGSNLNRSQSKMTLISRKASEIRKANEPWRDAFNRAKAMLYS